jgi:hypothetical protein
VAVLTWMPTAPGFLEGLAIVTSEKIGQTYQITCSGVAVPGFAQRPYALTPPPLQACRTPPQARMPTAPVSPGNAFEAQRCPSDDESEASQPQVQLRRVDSHKRRSLSRLSHSFQDAEREHSRSRSSSRSPASCAGDPSRSCSASARGLQASACQDTCATRYGCQRGSSVSPVRACARGRDAYGPSQCRFGSHCPCISESGAASSSPHKAQTAQSNCQHAPQQGSHTAASMLSRSPAVPSTRGRMRQASVASHANLPTRSPSASRRTSLIGSDVSRKRRLPGQGLGAAKFLSSHQSSASQSGAGVKESWSSSLRSTTCQQALDLPRAPEMLEPLSIYHTECACRCQMRSLCPMMLLSTYVPLWRNWWHCHHQCGRAFC